MNKVTILTATYNSEKTLEYTIRSVIEQDYPDIEYIIIDGDSKDRTLEIIEEYQDYGIVYISEPDNGLYDALNKGINMATGDYVYVLGSDDMLASSSIISKVVAQLDDSVDVLSGRVMLVDDCNGKSFPINNYVQRNKENYTGGNPPHQAIFIKRNLLEKYKFDTKYRIASDYKLFLQVYYDEEVNIKYIDKIIAFFASGGVSRDTKMIDKECNEIYKELGLAFHSPTTNGSTDKVKMLKKLLWKLNIYYIMKKMMMPIITIIRNKLLLQEHSCNNNNCRWCGRYIEKK